MSASVGRRLSAERGAELVEFALALPLLLMVFGGIVDYGLILQRHQVLSNAAREGARLAVLPGYVDADVAARVQDYVRVGIADSTAAPNTVVTRETLTPGSGPPFEAARVEVTLESRYLVLGPIVNLAGGTWTRGASILVRAASSMRIETVSGS